MASTEAGLGPVAEHSLDCLGAQADQLLVAHTGAEVTPGPAIAGAGRTVVGREGDDGENGALGVAEVCRVVHDGGNLRQMGLDGIFDGWFDADEAWRHARREDRRHVGS